MKFPSTLEPIKPTRKNQEATRRGVEVSLNQAAVQSEPNLTEESPESIQLLNYKPDEATSGQTNSKATGSKKLVSSTEDPNKSTPSDARLKDGPLRFRSLPTDNETAFVAQHRGPSIKAHH